MLGILMLCAMTSLLAAGIVSYMALRMIQNDSIEDNMKMYLDQITRNTDGAYYDMLSIMNYMGPGGLVGNVTDSYLGATDNFDRFIEQRTLREEMAGLGYVNTKLVGVMYYDREEKKELISGMNVRALDGSHASLPEVVECAGNVIQAAHSSILGSGEEPVFSVMREVVFGNGKRLDVYAEIEADMKTPEEINKAGRPYTYIQTDERRITRYSTNPVIIQGQKLFSTTLSDYQVETREGYKIMAYRSQMGYINAVALPDNMYQNEINHWRMRMTLIIVASFLIFALSVFYLYRIICRPLNQFRRQMVQIGNGALQAVHEESDIAEFDSLIDQTTRVTSFEIDVLKYRGEAEFMLGDYGAAAYTYDTLAKVDKPRAEYYYLGAVSLANSGDQDGAENRLESGKSADAKHEVTGYAEAMEALGAAYMTAGDEEKADELYQTLVDEGFSSTEVYNRWMMAAMEKGNYEEALQHAEAGLALSDDRAKKEIAFNQAVCYEYLGQYEKALELFRSYEEQYGQDEKADHEIAFLVTR